MQAEGGGGGCVGISFSSLMSDGICICSCGKVLIPTEKMQKKDIKTHSLRHINFDLIAFNEKNTIRNGRRNAYHTLVKENINRSDTS